MTEDTLGIFGKGGGEEKIFFEEKHMLKCGDNDEYLR